jgi:hypothetical protein
MCRALWCVLGLDSVPVHQVSWKSLPHYFVVVEASDGLNGMGTGQPTMQALSGVILTLGFEVCESIALPTSDREDE